MEGEERKGGFGEEKARLSARGEEGGVKGRMYVGKEGGRGWREGRGRRERGKGGKGGKGRQVRQRDTCSYSDAVKSQISDRDYGQEE